MDLVNECARKVYETYNSRENPWVGTCYEKHYELGNKQKGSRGEEILQEVFTSLGCVVERPLNTDHDLLVNGIKMECKFSLTQKETRKRMKQKLRPNYWMLNHVGVGKDWEWLCFVGVNPEGHANVIRLLSKEKFKEMKQDENVFSQYFSPQQGGKKAENDDWISGGTKLKNLLDSEYVIGIDKWLQIYV